MLNKIKGMDEEPEIISKFQPFYNNQQKNKKRFQSKDDSIIINIYKN